MEDELRVVERLVDECRALGRVDLVARQRRAAHLGSGDEPAAPESAVFSVVVAESDQILTRDVIIVIIVIIVITSIVTVIIIAVIVAVIVAIIIIIIVVVVVTIVIIVVITISTADLTSVQTSQPPGFDEKTSLPST